MKWEVIEPTRGVFNWTGADIIFDRAKQTDSLVRVHNFCWSSQSEFRERPQGCDDRWLNRLAFSPIVRHQHHGPDRAQSRAQITH